MVHDYYFKDRKGNEKRNQWEHRTLAKSGTLLYFALSTENCVGSLIAENEDSVAPSLFCKYNNYSGQKLDKIR